MDKEVSILSDDDIQLIKKAIEISEETGVKLWDQDILKPVKKKIKSSFRGLLGERCCYCCKNTFGEFNMVLDIEHILPKAHFKQFEFSPFNLSVACKRCNMNIKGEDRTFLKDQTIAKENPEDEGNYKFIHPNFNDYFQHIQYIVSIINDKKLIKYSVIGDSEKGKFTKEYFELEKLEVDSFNEAQGVKANESKYSDLMTREVVKEIQDLLE